jgi:hypothetical protein
MGNRPGRWSNIQDAIRDGDSKVLVEDTGTGQITMTVDDITVQQWTASAISFPAGDVTLTGDLTVNGGDIDLNATNANAMMILDPQSGGYNSVLRLIYDPDEGVGYYEIKTNENNLSIGTNLDSNIVLIQNNGDLQTDGDVTARGGVINAGIALSTYGWLQLEGNATGSLQGGKIQMQVADDYNATHNQIHIEAYGNDLRIGSNSKTSSLAWNYNTDEWQFSSNVYFDSTTLDMRGGTLNMANGSQWLINSATVEVSATELNYLYAVAPGTASPSKALVLDSGGDMEFSAGQTFDFTSGGQILMAASSLYYANAYVTATGAELNLLDGSIAGTVVASKAVVVDASRNLAAATGSRINNLSIDGLLESVGDYNCYGGDIRVGTSSTVKGDIYLYGHATASTAGGRIIIENALDYQGNVAEYYINASAGNLQIGNGASPSLIFDAVNTNWEITTPLEIQSGNLTVGNVGSTRGTLQVYGAATGSTVGGTINIHTADDYDTDISYYYLRADKDDLSLLNDDSGTAYMKFTAEGEVALEKGNLKTNLSSPTDLTLDCGSQKTLALAQPVWDDIVVTTNSVRFGGAAPVSEQLYKGGLVASFASGADNYLYFTLELPHSYKEGTDLLIHFHYVLPVAGSGVGVENIKFDLSFCPAYNNGVFGTPDTTGTVTVDVQNVAADDMQLSALHTITGTNLKISDTILCNIKRDTGVANPYGQDIYMIEVDAHYQVDTIGSRQQFIK